MRALTKFDDLLAAARLLPPPSIWERRAQQISWMVGQALCDIDHDENLEWELLRMAAHVWEARKHAYR